MWCNPISQVVEKLNLLESSNGTVLHSEIVGAIKMKVNHTLQVTNLHSSVEPLEVSAYRHIEVSRLRTDPREGYSCSSITLQIV